MNRQQISQRRKEAMELYRQGVPQAHGTTYSKDFSQFYRDVVWWGDDYAPDTFDKKAFLVQMLGRSPRDVIEHAQKVFGFTDEDFRAALYDAPPAL